MLTFVVVFGGMILVMLGFVYFLLRKGAKEECKEEKFFYDIHMVYGVGALDEFEEVIGNKAFDVSVTETWRNN